MVVDTLRSVTDTALEALVLPSFSRIGPAVRRRLFDWAPIADASGRRIVITGANSGLGRAGAELLVVAGADVVVVARNEARGQAAVDELNALDASGSATLEIGDMSSLESVAALAERLLAGPPIDVLVHNAGALLEERQESVDGIEITLATHVVGPFALTEALRPSLAKGSDPRIITMASGGLYSQGISLSDLQNEKDYTGTKAYARAKRIQLVTSRRWQEILEPQGISIFTMHPGWAATPGVADALPAFDTVMAPLLRTPEEGADTLAWLATEPTSELGNGGFWLDRGRRPEHRLPKTKDADGKLDEIWSRLEELAKTGPIT